MKRKPSAETTAAWIRLVRIQSRVLGAVEQELKRAGFPPLSWYDALLELSRAPCGALRPVELEKQMLLPQYGLSRLIDRLVDNALVARKVCEADKRGLVVEITEKGRELQKKMWGAYSAAIERHIGSKISDSDAAKLSALLDQLGCSCDAVICATACKIRLIEMTLSHFAVTRCCALQSCPIQPRACNVAPLVNRVFHGA